MFKVTAENPYESEDSISQDSDSEQIMKDITKSISESLDSENNAGPLA